MRKKVYVWEVPVRLTHWLNVLSILALSVTGLYIGAPFMHAANENRFIMAQMRYIHFISSYVLLVSFLIRIYWFFVGNRYAQWHQWVPVSSERLKNIYGTTAFYCFLREKCPEVVGHTGLAGVSYLVLFIFILIEMVTGYALYSQSHFGGLWNLMGGWLLAIMSTGAIRLIHHLTMWAFAVFVIIHVYISLHNDMMEKNGLLTSIFSGYKTIEE